MWLYVDRPGGERPFRVPEHPIVIGRDPSSDVVLEGEGVSRQHAEVELLGEGAIRMRDLGSKNGTFVDDRRLTDVAVLRGGETVRIGDHRIRVRQRVPIDPLTTVAIPPARPQQAGDRPPSPPAPLEGRAAPPLAGVPPAVPAGVAPPYPFGADPRSTAARRWIPSVVVVAALIIGLVVAAVAVLVA